MPVPSSSNTDLARQVLAHEAAGNPSQSVCEKLRRPLSSLAGATGFRALLTRALALAKAQDAGFGTVQVKPDGSLNGLGEAHNGVLLIAELLGLLISFIGEPLTRRLLEDVWPDLALYNSDSVEQDQYGSR